MNCLFYLEFNFLMKDVMCEIVDRLKHDMSHYHQPIDFDEIREIGFVDL